MKNVCSLCSLLWWMWGMVKCVCMRARVADGLWLFWCTIFLHLNIYVAEPMAQTIYIHMYMCNNWIPCIFFVICQKGHFKPNSRSGYLFDSCCCWCWCWCCSILSILLFKTIRLFFSFRLVLLFVSLTISDPLFSFAILLGSAFYVSFMKWYERAWWWLCCCRLAQTR